MKIFKPSIVHALLCILFGTTTIWAQSSEEIMMKYANTIQPNDLRDHLMILASDEYEGRETAEKGGYMAAKYIAEYFRSLDVQPQDGDSYSQKFPLDRTEFQARLQVGDSMVPYLDEFMYFDNEASSFKATEVQFLGYGIESENYNDYEGINEVSKVVMMMGGEPVNAKGNYLVTGSEERSEWAGVFDSEKRAQIASAKGAEFVLFVLPGYKSRMARFRSSIEGPRLNLILGENEEERNEPTVIFISEGLADLILGEGNFTNNIEKIRKKGKPVNASYSTALHLEVETRSERTYATNELAFIPGSDLGEELIVITAHYDHIGMSAGRGKETVVNNGADDDGSGTVSLLELVQAFQTAYMDGHGPRRSVLLMAVSGEEKGLFGSKYYTSNPVYPLESTVCDLNIDMVGRVDQEHEEDREYIYLIGSDRLSQELHDISEMCNEEYVGLELDYKYNDPKDPNRYYYRSDHYNFAEKGIPVIFYFNGTHEDYHAPTDTPEKIDYELMAKRAQLIFITAWNLANRDERIELNEIVEE